MPLERSDVEIFQAFHDAVKDDHRKIIPATITAVHADTCTVDVVPAIQNPLFDEFGAVSYETLPSLKGVPLGIIRGGGFLVWVPVQPGDSVLLVFSDLSTDSWRASTPGGSPVQPVFVGKHTPAGPFAIPCVAPDSAAPTSPVTASGNLIIGKDGAQQQIQISSSLILLGESAAQFVALSNLVDTAVSSIVTAFNTHTHQEPYLATGTVGSPVLVSGSPVVTATPLVPLIPPAPTGATLVKAQ